MVKVQEIPHIPPNLKQVELQLESEERSSEVSEETENSNHALYLSVNQIPGWSELFLFGIQQALLCMSGLLVIPFLVSEIACAGRETIPLRVQLISATFVTCGVATLLQTTFGLRLAILHGPSFAFVPALYAYKSMAENECRYGMNDIVPVDEWNGRVLTLQGSLFCACLLMIVVGGSGLVGLFSRYVGPATICPLILLLEIGTVPTLLEKISLHWVAILEFAVLVIFALFLENVEVPVAYFSLKERKIRKSQIRLFGQFPYLLGIGLVWFFCFILTVTDLEAEGGEARTDKNTTVLVLKEAPWIQIPFPGQFGFPRVSPALFFGFVASCIACMMETIGHYQVCSKISHQSPPPSATVNRGIMVEGIGSCLAALMGVGTGVTTYAENIALMHVTRVCSRSTMQMAGCFLIIFGLFTKLAAALASIPDALVGGLLAMGMSMVAGVALSNLRTMDLRLSRNLTVMGVAIICGMAIPDYFKENPVKTGNVSVDQIFNMLISIRMLIGGLIAFILDNSVPGASRRERGFVLSESNGEKEVEGEEEDGYALQPYLQRMLRRLPHLQSLPFFPKMSKFTRT